MDKFLWAIRVFKTRSQATAHCKEGKVAIAGKAVKPALELKGSERIEVRKGAVTFAYEIISFPKSRVGAGLVADHARDVTSADQIQRLEEIRATQKDLIRPVGRPTKRDRRDWERHFGE